jgi:hypothetical protein
MGIEEQVVAKMRSDWAVVAQNRRESGDWTESEEADILAAIKAAIDAKDKTLIACWSRWLADLSAWVTAWNLICRGSEAAMRTEARKHREQSNQVKDRP